MKHFGQWKSVCWLWGFVWQRYLFDYDGMGMNNHKIWKPIKVTGWRSALCQLGGYKRQIAPCPWGLK